MGEGDGTVSLMYTITNDNLMPRSSGYMCVKGWKIDRYNPAQIAIITREMDHEPEFLDLRGGPKTAGNTYGFSKLIPQITLTF
jgi:phospholipid:diacylglycerol acyltransferase